MVGVKGFEPLTFWSRTKRATSLRYTPGVVNGRGWKSTKLHLPCQPASAFTQLFIVMDTKPKNGKTPLVKFKDTERGLFFYHERA